MNPCSTRKLVMTVVRYVLGYESDKPFTDNKEQVQRKMPNYLPTVLLGSSGGDREAGLD